MPNNYEGTVFMDPSRAARLSELPAGALDPSTTLPHEIGHAFGLIHTHAGHNEVRANFHEKNYYVTVENILGLIIIF